MKKEINMKSKVKVYIMLLMVFIALASVVKLDEISFSLTSKVEAYLKEKHFRGVALFAKEEKIVFSMGYGYANVEHQIPSNLEHSPVRELHQELARLIDPSWRGSAGL
jgi:hypothetical protein